MELKPENLRAAIMMMQMQYSLPAQQMIVEFVNEKIGKVRADIISGNKTEAELNILLDELQRLSIKKRDTEAKLGSIRHAYDICKKLDEAKAGEEISISEHYERLKKLMRNGEES